MNKRAFIFSLEAMVALLISLLFIGSILFMITSINDAVAYSDSMRPLSQDILTLLDDSNQMLNETRVSVLIDDLLPNRFCARLDVSNTDDYLVYSYIKKTCKETGEQYIISKRTYIDGDNMYVAKILMWYND
ncbi:MAG: hypothetical protein WC755_00830 [Candidatus Woesearchaeota archaeon]|jgi:hypothetical protein